MTLPMEKMTKARLLDELKSARADWDALIAKVVAQKGKAALVEPGAAREWSVRDLTAHLTSYDRWFVNAAEAQLRGEAPPQDGTEWMEWDERNAIHHQRTLSQPLDEVMAESASNYQRLVELVALLPEAFLIEPQQPPGVPQPFVVWEQLRGNTYGHYRLHMHDIAGWLGTP